jgi:WD40 repeat protein
LSDTEVDALGSLEIAASAKVFISYSRTDVAFADRLDAALKARGFEPLIDRTEIFAFEDWWDRIEALIAQSDTVVFVLSPDAVASDICAKEVEFAASLHKRFAPVVCRRVEPNAIPEPLRRLNLIFCEDGPNFEVSMNQLAEALSTDIAWVRKHTEFSTHARRWETAGRPGPRGLLLRSPVLEEAEHWIATRPRGAPDPTDATLAFIAESRRAATQRRNVLTASLAVGLVAALALAGLAYWQRSIAVGQRVLAESRRTAALAEMAVSKRLSGRLDTALRLSVHATRLALEENLGASATRAALAAAVWQSDWRLILIGHEEIVDSAAFSPDGSRIVTASSDTTARIWDAATAREIAVLRGHDKSVFSASFSPDGSRIITASSDKTARIWNAATGDQLAVLRVSDFAVSFAAFSPDGSRIVTSSYDSNVRVWDAITLTQIAELRGAGGSESKVAFSPDGSRIATNGQIWDAVTFKSILRLERGGAISPAAFSPDGSRVVSVSRGADVVISDAATGKVTSVIRGHENGMTSAIFSPDGSRIAATDNSRWLEASDNAIRVWDAATGSEVAVMSGHQGGVKSVSFNSDGTRLVTASADKTARIWTIARHAPIATLRTQGASGDTGIRSVAYSPDGSRIVTASGNAAQVWDIAAAREIAVLRGHESWVQQAAFSPDGLKVVTASGDKTARFWDAATGKESGVLRGHQSDVNSAVFSPDGSRIATAAGGMFGGDYTARIWDAGTAQEIAVLRGHKMVVWSVAFSPDGSRIVTLSWDGTARIWDAITFKEIAIMPIQTIFGRFGAASFSPDGRQIVTSSQDTAHIWDSTTAKELASLQGSGSIASFAAFSPSGLLIVTASVDRVRLWDVATMSQIALLPQAAHHAAFSPDGSRLVTASGDAMHFWDTHFAKMSASDLVLEVCLRRLRGVSTLSRDEMRLAGYASDMPAINVCAGIE